MRLSFLSLVLILLCIQCTSIAKRQEYEDSLRAYKKANLEKAFEYLPTEERKGFIAVLERAHLGFLKGGIDYKSLERIAEESKERLRFSATRSLKSFFYMETEEGYYASEAEIIYLHILLGLYYVRVGDYEKGKSKLGMPETYSVENGAPKASLMIPPYVYYLPPFGYPQVLSKKQR